MFQVVDRLIDVVQPVALRVQFDLALGVERHQLAQLGVVADEASNHRDFREDDIDRTAELVAVFGRGLIRMVV